MNVSRASCCEDVEAILRAVDGWWFLYPHGAVSFCRLLDLHDLPKIYLEAYSPNLFFHFFLKHKSCVGTAATVWINANVG